MTGSPADEDYATLSGYWEGWEDEPPASTGEAAISELEKGR